MYTETKTPWWSWLLLIAPIALSFSSINMARGLFDPERIEREQKQDDPQEAKAGDKKPELTPKELADKNNGLLFGVGVQLAVAVVVILSYLCTRKYYVEASDLGIRFGYQSFLSTRVSRQDIQRVYRTDLKMREFLGLGVRIGIGTKRIGYVCWFGEGVHIQALKGSKVKKYAFSCTDPEACIAALNLTEDQLGPEEEDQE